MTAFHSYVRELDEDPKGACHLREKEIADIIKARLHEYDIDGEADFDQSGFSVSLSADGTTVAIGARLTAGTGSNAGHVRIYSLAEFFVPIPTMSQWALFILGLCLTSLAVVKIRKVVLA